MKMTGEQRIAAPRTKVWEALNDPDVLRQCIPGCQSLERDADHGFVALAEVKIGPIGARFKGNVQLSDLDAPNSYTITGSGSGGIAGSAKGTARVRLSEVSANETRVSYDVEAEVGGRMAQLGGAIIDATAKNLAGKFFAKFGEVVVSQGVGAGSPVPTAETAFETAAAVPVGSAAMAPRSSAGSTLWGWVAAVVFALFTGFAIGQLQGMGTSLLFVVVLVVVTAAAAFEAGRRGGGK